MPTDHTRFDEIAAALELDLLTPKERESILLDIHSIVFRSSFVKLMDHMEGDTKETFITMLEHGADMGDVEIFLTEQVPQAETVVAQTVREITDDILAVAYA